MPYGTIKIDTITFTDGGVDKSVPVSGLVLNPTFTGNVTVTGTISGNTIQGGTIVSGLTVTGTTANFASGVFSTQVSGVTITGTTVAATTGTFTSLTGTTTNGTTASFTTGNFTSLTGTTTTGTTANFASGVFTTQVSGLLITGPTVSATTGTFTSLTGTTTTGTTANFVSGVFTTQISGVTITGTTVSTTTGTFVSLTGTTATFTSGIIASGTAALPSLAILSDSDTGIYSPGANQLAISTNGVQRLSVAANGDVAFSNSIDLPNINTFIKGGGHNVVQVDATRTYVYGGTNGVQIRTADNVSPLLDITNAGLVGIGTSAPSEKLTINGNVAFNTNDQFIKFNSFYGSPFTGSMGSILAFNSAYESEVAAINFYQTGGNTADILFRTGLAGSSTERMRIDSSGRVGIGTTSPQSLLNISTASVSGDQNVFICGTSATGINGSHALYLGAYGSTQYGCKIKSIYNYASTVSTTLAFETSNAGTLTEAVRIDSSGRLLVGTSSESGNALLTVRGNTGSATGAGVLDIGLGTTRPGSADTPIGYIRFTSTSNTSSNYHYASIAAESDGTSGSDTDIPGRLVFSTTADGASSPTERMRINNTGDSFIYSNFYPLTVATNQGAGTTYQLITGRYSATSTTTGTDSFRVHSNGNVQNTNGSYTAISDAKLKENIVDASSQWNDLKAIHIRNWNFKEETGYETHRQIGPIAQELEAVCPGLVFETPDRDDKGNDLGTVTKGVNQSVLYMKAVKALQEAMERIEQLEAKVAALESA